MENKNLTCIGCPMGCLRTVKVAIRHNLVVSVKTQNPIPKDLVLTLANHLNELSVNAPVHIGDIVEENICNTGVNLIVTKNII